MRSLLVVAASLLRLRPRDAGADQVEGPSRAPSSATPSPIFPARDPYSAERNARSAPSGSPADRGSSPPAYKMDEACRPARR